MGPWKTYGLLTFLTQVAPEKFPNLCSWLWEERTLVCRFFLTIVDDRGNSHGPSSAIIQHIVETCEAGQASIVYFYFDFRDKEKQNVRKLVTSLLIQLSAFADACFDVIHGVYSAYGNGKRQPTNDVLTNCLKEMLTAVAEHPIYIVMDALDECPDNSGIPTAREEVLDVLKCLVDLDLPNLRVCATSRPEVDIKSILNQLAIHTVSLHDEHEQQKGIADYVSTIVNSDRKMREWPDEDKELVIKVLSERADGM
jgi:hypothetical protein